MINKKYLVILLLNLCGMVALAQNAPYRFRNLSVNEGLSQNSIWQMIRSTSGYLWVGTADGLNRYDGYDVTVFKHRPGDVNSIGGNNITFLYEDKNGCLWVGHEAGVDVFNPVTETFRHAFRFRELSPAYYTSYLLFDDPSSDHIWVYLAASGIHKFSIQKQHLVADTFFRQAFDIRSYGIFLKGYRVGKKGYLLFDGGKIEEVDLATGRRRQVLRLRGSCYDFKVFNQKLYYVRDHVLVSYDLGTGITRAELPMPQIEICVGINRFKDQWVIISESGYVMADTTGRRVQFYESFDGSKKQSYNRMASFLYDEQGMLWFGTDGKGIFYTSLYCNKFEHYQAGNDAENMVKSICILPGNKLVTAVYKKGLVIYNLNDHNYYTITGNMAFPGMQTDQFTSVCQAGEHQVWVSNTEQVDCGLFLVDLITGKGINYSHLVKRFYHPLPRTSYFTGLLRNDSSLYVLNFDKVIEVFRQGDTYQSKVLYHEPGEVFTAMYVTGNGRYFFTGYGKGVTVRKPVDTSFQHKLKLDALELVKCINEDLAGNYYVATTSGMYVYDSSFALQRHYTTSNGLADNFIYGILRDDASNMWLSHNKGLSCFSTRYKSFRHYTVNDGLQSNEFNTGAFHKDVNGRLYFGGVNGVNAFYPQQVKSNPNKPAVYISSIKVFDEPYKSDTAYWLKRTIVLPYQQNTLSFDFIGSEMSDQQRNSYAYKMEGIDETWINNGNRRSARYPNLQAGSYTFMVKAANPDGTWNDVPASLHIMITPPFWKTGWFYALIIILGSGLLAALVYLFMSRQQRKLRAELEVQQKLEDQRLRISRDLHDHVGAQLSYLITNIDWMREHPGSMNPEESGERLTTLSDTGKQAILTLRQTIWALNSTELLVTEFADKFKQYAAKMMQFSPGTEISFHEQFNRERILNPSDALNLFRICQETLSNALSHARAKHIEVSFAANNEILLGFTLNDDGCGFAWEELDTNGHYGLENMKARAAECGAELVINSQKGTGTQVSLLLLKDYRI